MSGPEAEDTPTVDHEFLLGLAREKSSKGRARLSETIMDLFENKGEALTDRERALMFGILRSVVREIEMTIRQRVAQHLAGLGDVPEDLIRILANDEIDVAYPVLTESGLLKDDGLIEIIRHRTMEHQLAVAIRQSISEEVSQALVETGDERVVVTLLKNANAQISQSTMEYLVEQSRRVDSFQEPVLQRKELRPELAERMYLWVSAALREFIIANFSLDQAVIDDLIERVASEEGIVSPHEPNKLKVTELAASLHDEGMVTPDMLITALSQGEVSLFLALFCRLTGIREYLAQRILFEPGGEGLAICCKAVGLTKDEFSEIFRYSQMVRSRGSDSIDQALGEILWIYEDMSREAAAGVLKTWRRNKGYLAAIRQIQSTTRRHA